MARAGEQGERSVVQEECQQRGLLGGALVVAGRWRAFWRRLSTRKALLRLSDEQLSDIGLNRAQALNEAERPFWSLWRDD